MGEDVRVSADIYADGHDTVAAVVRFRRVGRSDVRESVMTPVDNDRWQAAFSVDALAATNTPWKSDRSVCELAGRICRRRPGPGRMFPWNSPRARRWLPRRFNNMLSAADHQLGGLVDALGSEGELGPRVAAALNESLSAFMARYPDRSQSTHFGRVLPVLVERERARFAARDEMLPGRPAQDPSRSATFAEAAGMLAYVASMDSTSCTCRPCIPSGGAFEKVRTTRSSTSPMIPGAHGRLDRNRAGTRRWRSGLGTLEDFDAFVAAAAAQGLEIALDIAFQASPDHLVPRDHPDWFRRRRDGTIKYAETRPKTSGHLSTQLRVRGLACLVGQELKDIFEFWIQHGVRSSGSTIHTPNRFDSGRGCWLSSRAIIQTSSSWRKPSPGRRS